MTEELAKKWAAALRSGKYQQGRNYLRTKDERYCCLGVLVDIQAPQEWCDVDGSALAIAGGELKSVLSVKLRERFGVGSSAHDDLVNMNDFYGKSFNDIADYFEANWSIL